MSSKNLIITPEISIDSTTFYLIRIDKEEMCFVNTEKEAKLAVDSIGASEVKRMEKEGVKIYREDLNDGKKVVISSQTLGTIYNGSIIQEEEIDYVPVSHAVLTKGRHELRSTTPPPPPPPPSENLFRAIAERRNQVTSQAEENDSDDDTDDEEVDINSDDEEYQEEDEDYDDDEDDEDEN